MPLILLNSLFILKVTNLQVYFITLCFSEFKNMDEKGSSCLGGDNLSGLKVVNEEVNIATGEIVVGRSSSSFLGKVT